MINFKYREKSDLCILDTIVIFYKASINLTSTKKSYYSPLSDSNKSFASSLINNRNMRISQVIRTFGTSCTTLDASHL